MLINNSQSIYSTPLLQQQYRKDVFFYDLLLLHLYSIIRTLHDFLMMNQEDQLVQSLYFYFSPSNIMIFLQLSPQYLQTLQNNLFNLMFNSIFPFQFINGFDSWLNYEINQQNKPHLYLLNLQRSYRNVCYLLQKPV